MPVNRLSTLDKLCSNCSVEPHLTALPDLICCLSCAVQVTGGSAGIGKAAALAFAQNGARVAVMGRRKERLDAVLVELPEGLAVVGDLMSIDDCKRAVTETVAACGGLDVLVNNGGCGSGVAGCKACWMYQLFIYQAAPLQVLEAVFPQVATVSPHRLNCAGGALWETKRLIGSYNTRAVGL